MNMFRILITALFALPSCSQEGSPERDSVQRAAEADNLPPLMRYYAYPGTYYAISPVIANRIQAVCVKENAYEPDTERRESIQALGSYVYVRNTCYRWRAGTVLYDGVFYRDSTSRLAEYAAYLAFYYQENHLASFSSRIASIEDMLTPDGFLNAALLKPVWRAPIEELRERMKTDSSPNTER